MQHPFELQIEDLQAIDFDLIDLGSIESARVVGGADGSAGVTADGVGPNEVGGPFTAPLPTDPGTITADGVGPNEVGGPFTPGTYRRWLWVKKVGVVNISLVLAVVLGTVGNLGTITRTGENGVVGNVCHAIVKATSILNDIIRSYLATHRYPHCDG
jgi:hypothetical protein